MARVSHELRSGADNAGHRSLIFQCPGCQETHQVCIQGPGASWSWNGSLDAPTFQPSIKVTWPANPDAAPGFEEWLTERCCHSFVTDGQIQFLTDCTHALAGQTVDLPEWDEG